MIYDLFYMGILIAFSVCMFFSGMWAAPAYTSDCDDEKAALILGTKVARILFWSSAAVLFLVLLVVGVRM